MAYSQYSNVTDELLSAYIDGAVTAAERALVEDAVANDQRVAWRLETLRHTVTLLGQLSDVPLPRSFTLNEALLAESATLSTASSPAAGRTSPSTGSTETPSFWARWRDFWGSGNVLWRNAAAVCALLLLLVLVGDNLITPQYTQQQASRPMADAKQADSMASDVAADKIAEQEAGAGEATVAAMAPAPMALDMDASENGAPMAEVGAAESIETRTDEEADTVDVIAAVEKAEAETILAPADAGDVAVTNREYAIEPAQVQRAAPSRDDAAASRTRMETASASSPSSPTSSTDNTTFPSRSSAGLPENADDESRSLMAAGIGVASIAPTTAAPPSMDAPQPMAAAALSAPESPLAFEAAMASQRAASAVPVADEAAEPMPVEAQMAETQATPEDPTPVDMAEKIPSTVTPAAVALAESVVDAAGAADQPSAAAEVAPSAADRESSSVRQAATEFNEALMPSTWQIVALAGQVAILLLLILFLVLWLRSRTKRAA